MKKHLLLSVCLIMNTAYVFAYEWQIESTGLMPDYPDKVTFNIINNKPAVLYPVATGASYSIKYAIKENGNWVVETAISGATNLAYSNLSLQVMANNEPITMYTEYPIGPRSYTHVVYRTPQGWQTEVVETSSNSYCIAPADLIAADNGDILVVDDNSNRTWRKTVTGWDTSYNLPSESVYSIRKLNNGEIAGFCNTIVSYGNGPIQEMALLRGNVFAFLRMPTIDVNGRAEIIGFNEGKIGVFAIEKPTETKVNLIYAEETDWNWNLSALEALNDSDLIFKATALPNQEPSVAYRRSAIPASELIFAYRSNGTWEKDTVLTGVARVIGVGILDNRPVIAYISSDSPRQIKIATIVPDKLLTINVQPVNINAAAVLPNVGPHNVYSEMVQIKASSYIECPNVYRFDHWEGDVADPNAANTTVMMDTNKTITAYYRLASSVCGDECHPNFTVADLNHDCSVDIQDYAIFSSRWLNCTKPECD